MKYIHPLLTLFEFILQGLEYSNRIHCWLVRPTPKKMGVLRMTFNSTQRQYSSSEGLGKVKSPLRYITPRSPFFLMNFVKSNFFHIKIQAFHLHRIVILFHNSFCLSINGSNSLIGLSMSQSMISIVIWRSILVLWSVSYKPNLSELMNTVHCQYSITLLLQIRHLGLLV